MTHEKTHYKELAEIDYALWHGFAGKQRLFSINDKKHAEGLLVWELYE